MTRLGRLDAPARIQGVDLARGLAVLGMFVAHLLTVPAFSFADPASWADLSYGRSAILFATLAGVSIGLVTGGPRPVRGAPLARAALRLVVRAVLLFFLGYGLIWTLVPIAQILPAYALLFVVALPFLRLPPRVLLPVALLAGLVTPFLLAPIDGAVDGALAPGAYWWTLLGWAYPFVVWISFVLAGLGLARCDVRRLRTQVGMLVGGAALAAVGYGLDAAVTSPPAWLAPVWTAEGHSSGLLEVIGSGGFAIAVIGLCCLACRTVIGRILLPLRATGSMPLTAYTAQVLVWWVVARSTVGDLDDLQAFRATGFFWWLAVGVVVGCTLWAAAVGRGPLEWLIDLVVRTVVPSRRLARPDATSAETGADADVDAAADARTPVPAGSTRAPAER